MLAVAAAAVIGAGAAAAKEAGAHSPRRSGPAGPSSTSGKTTSAGHHPAGGELVQAPRKVSEPSLCACVARSSIARWPLHFRPLSTLETQ